MNVSLLQMMTQGSVVQPPTKSANEVDGMSVSNWGRCLDIILQAEMSSATPLEKEALGVYKIEITNTPVGTETYYIELTLDTRRVTNESDPPIQKPDVWVTVSSSDLAGILEGTLSPLQVKFNKKNFFGGVTMLSIISSFRHTSQEGSAPTET
jgi:hypothetical protein